MNSEQLQLAKDSQQLAQQVCADLEAMQKNPLIPAQGKRALSGLGMLAMVLLSRIEQLELKVQLRPDEGCPTCGTFEGDSRLTKL